MNTLETDIEIRADGSVKLLAPMPTWLRPGRNHVLLVMADVRIQPMDVGTVERGIAKTQNVCGGDACIANTRLPVWSLEQARRLGFSDAELLQAYPSLMSSDLASAWAYVERNPTEVDQAIRENEEA